MRAGGPARWLLVGNSRWHWAEGESPQRRYWSEPPAAVPQVQPERWAAAGAVPQGLDPSRRLQLVDVPLRQAPPWLGVDRALAGYQAWSLSAAAVLVADAGTAMSLTWIDSQGRFGGGRLMAGAALQWRALHGGTAALPLVAAPPPSEAQELWPQPTDAALVSGVLQGLAGALQRAAAQLQLQQPGLQLWLTGGDGAVLHGLLQDPSWRLCPGLCLDGLATVAGLS